MKKLILLLLVLCVAATGILAQKTAAAKSSPQKTAQKATTAKAGTNTAAVKEVDAYVKKVDAFVKRSKNSQLVFADTASQNSTRSKWRQFTNEKALEKFREKTETYEIAYAWKQESKIVETSTTLFSGSGDWVNYVYHYYRPDGSLAKVESDFRSFYGDIIVEQSVYYDAKGKQLKKSVVYKDLTTKKFKKVDPKSDSVSMSQFTTYKTVKKLPFAHLLPKK